MENHGFVGNYMYDEHSGKEFKLTLDNPESLHPDWWNKAESFFITAEKQVQTFLLMYICILYIFNMIPKETEVYRARIQRSENNKRRMFYLATRWLVFLCSRSRIYKK